MVLRAGIGTASEQSGHALQGLHLSSAASGLADETLHLNTPVLTVFHLLLFGFRSNYFHFCLNINGLV